MSQRTNLGVLIKAVLWAPALASLILCLHSSVNAGVIFGTDGALGGGFRWDAAPRIINGNERSLDGGLRYSVQGGSMQAYRDLFSWDVVPTIADFSTAVRQAFDAWTSVDPATNLTTAISFVDDTANTPVVGTPGFGGGVDTDGAEIDLFGVDAGDDGRRGVAWFDVELGNVTLTSGTTGYGGAEGGGAVSGADIYINANPGAVFSLDLFRRLLTHELGHALALADVEDFFGNGFIDDNYDGSTRATVRATLSNSWALLVNPLDPAASDGLTHFPPGTVANGRPGLDNRGVDILMESEGLGISVLNPVTELVPLRNDDYGTRQFLYPAFVVPEPANVILIWIGMIGLVGYLGKR